jgi:hypothetical protein
VPLGAERPYQTVSFELRQSRLGGGRNIRQHRGAALSR